MNPKALLCEFIGTFTLIFIGVGAIAGGSGLVGVAIAHGLAIAVMATATGAISGGHLNPAVTFAMLLTGKIKPLDSAGYVVAQCAGATAAAFLLTMTVPAETITAINLGTPSLAAAISPMRGMAMEAILTFFLVFVVFGTAVDSRAPKMGALFIGFAVMMDIFIGGPLTGAAMNPARHFGPAMFAPGAVTNVWVYWAGPLLGAAVAGLVYHHVLEPKK